MLLCARTQAAIRGRHQASGRPSSNIGIVPPVKAHARSLEDDPRQNGRIPGARLAVHPLRYHVSIHRSPNDWDEWVPDERAPRLRRNQLH
jgi:hypothetical protein